MAKYSEAQKKAVAKYKENNYVRRSIDFRRELYDKIKDAADTSGESFAGYITTAVKQRMKQDNMR